MNKYNIIILIIVLIYITLLINSKEQFNLHKNIIPKKIFLSYKTKNIPDNIIKHLQKLNEDYEIHLYDNDDCRQFIKDNYTQLHVDIFNFLEDGPIKADFWRLCILYKYGGVYSDIDIEFLVSIDTIINMEKDATFYTCNSIGGGLNPHVIITVKEHPLIGKCIEEYIRKYRSGEKYSYWGYSITGIMSYKYEESVSSMKSEGIYEDKNKRKYMIISEVGEIKRLSEVYCSYKNIRLLNNRQRSYDPNTHEFR